MNYLKTCGQYAEAYHNNLISNEELIIENLAYVDDNLYDKVGDMIAMFYHVNREPITSFES
ncbi:hypothetical protein ACVRX5_03580 [Streptococcus loxodontisalivarius]|uniref:Uncharacterized protein n=2 Tax=Streptococcus loxodontisalivarius TaxID=1349415 RepID=A0ABS2PPI4_9STRE|nr:hypothetical protein [Streptococcus loxodontisalivarius]MBM7641801.1 hypothetical protein [Streptococcus loxodontisalivarius]